MGRWRRGEMRSRRIKEKLVPQLSGLGISCKECVLPLDTCADLLSHSLVSAEEEDQGRRL